MGAQKRKPFRNEKSGVLQLWAAIVRDQAPPPKDKKTHFANGKNVPGNGGGVKKKITSQVPDRKQGLPSATATWGESGTPDVVQGEEMKEDP